MGEGLIKVVQVIPAFTVGGAEWMAAHLAAHLPSQQFERLVISLHGPRNSPIEAYLARHGIPIFYINKRRGFDGRVWARLYRLLRSLQPNIVHTHQMVGRYVYPVCWLLRHRPIVHTVHSIATGEIDSWFWRRFQALAYRRGVYPVSIAYEVTRTFIQEYGRPPASEIPNGIPTADYAPNPHRRHEWRRHNSVPSDALLYVCVASLRPLKNHPLLLQAFTPVAMQLSNALLLLVGGADRLNPDYSESLKQQAQQMGLDSRVRFLGSRSDVPDVLRASDIFVLSSDYEGNPLSVMEAMAAGLPVVSTAVGGVPELVTHGMSGLLTPAGDANALTEAMLKLGCDETLRTAMGRAAYETARAKFDVQTMSHAYARFYLKVLSCSSEGTQRE